MTFNFDAYGPKVSIKRFLLKVILMLFTMRSTKQKNEVNFLITKNNDFNPS